MVLVSFFEVGLTQITKKENKIEYEDSKAKLVLTYSSYLSGD